MATPTISEMTQALRALEGDDRKFLQSLIFSAETRGMTPKQEHWAERMVQKATTGSDTTMGDLAPINALFAKAAKHLNRPAIVLGYRVATETREIKVYPAGERSRTPGAIQVKDVGDGRWFGRILTDGNFEHSRRDPPPSGVSAVLREFAADPAGTAAAHGHLTGRCCFCNRKLSDERSTAVGYGKTCSEHFGVPWGAKVANLAQDGRLPLGAPTARLEREADYSMGVEVLRDQWEREQWEREHPGGGL